MLKEAKHFFRCTSSFCFKPFGASKETVLLKCLLLTLCSNAATRKQIACEPRALTKVHPKFLPAKPIQSGGITVNTSWHGEIFKRAQSLKRFCPCFRTSGACDFGVPGIVFELKKARFSNFKRTVFLNFKRSGF